MADLEDQHPSVSVGGMAYDLGMPQAGALPSSGVFGKFIELARRKQKLTAEGLAARAGVDLRELVAIEQNANVQPRVMTVHQLAKFFATVHAFGAWLQAACAWSAVRRWGWAAVTGVVCWRGVPGRIVSRN